ncbi:MAG TPA: YncE family protein, partial [Thermoplasmata archaeon]|nr:YncE family protein [Thermoplasmata archaeon]
MTRTAPSGRGTSAFCRAPLPLALLALFLLGSISPLCVTPGSLADPGTPIGRGSGAAPFAVANGSFDGGAVAESTLVLFNNTTYRGNYLAENGLGPEAIAFDNRTNLLFVSCPGSSPNATLDVLNGTTGALVRTAPLPPGSHRLAVVSSLNELFVTDTGGFVMGRNVSIVNESTLKVTGTIGVGYAPEGITYDPDNGRLYVVNNHGGSQSTVSVINASARTVTATIPVGNGSSTPLLDRPARELFVLNPGTTNLSIINVTRGAVVATLRGIYAYTGLALNTLNGSVYVVNSSVSKINAIDPKTNRIAMTINTGYSAGIQTLSFDPADRDVLFSGFSNSSLGFASTVNGSTQSIDRIGQGTASVTYDPSDGYLYEFGTSNVTVLGAVNRSLVGSFYVLGSPTSGFVNPGTGDLFIPGPNSNLVALARNGTLKVAASTLLGSEPSDAVYDAATDSIFVTDSSDNAVSVLNATTHHLRATVGVGSDPTAEVLDPEAGSLWVVNHASNSVSVINASSDSLVSTLPVHNEPTRAVWDSFNGNVYVANYLSHNISVFNGTSRQLIATVPVGQYPADLAVDSRTGTVYSLNDFDENISVISGSTNQVIATFHYGGSSYNGAAIEYVQYDPVHDLVDIGSASPNAVFFVNPLTGKLASTTYVGTGNTSSVVNGLGLDPGTGEVFVDYIYGGPNYGVAVALNGSTGKVQALMAVGEGASGIYPDPAASSMLVLNSNSNNVSVIDTGRQQVVANVPVGSTPNNIAVDPRNGTFFVTNNGQGTLSIAEPGATYPVTFTESGLPQGAGWSVTLDGGRTVSGSGSLVVRAPNGTYQFSIGTPTDFVASPSHGTVTVNATGVQVSIRFLELFPVYLNESGLPKGKNWSATLNGSSVRSSNASLTFLELNGTYAYNLSSVPGWRTVAYRGNVTVSGSPSTVLVAWTRTVYNVTFIESGLPSGTNWSVIVNGTLLSGVGQDLLGQMPNGSFPYSVGLVSGYYPTPSQGSVDVSGGLVWVTISWTRTTYLVEFSERGLPSGTRWNLSLNGTSASSTNSTIEFSEPNGTFAYAVTDIGGWHLDRQSYSGSVVVNGSSAIPPPFQFSEVVYNVTFREAGLPNGTRWTVALNGSVASGGSDQFTFSEPNGSFVYRVSDVAGWHQSSAPYNGVVTVGGSSLTGPVFVFARVVYAVNFSESGLPSDMAWGVAVNGSITRTVGATVSVPEPNGTYVYRILDVPGWHEYLLPYAGALLVIGANYSEPRVPFVQLTYPVGFAEGGLPGGTAWAVALNGTTDQ